MVALHPEGVDRNDGKEVGFRASALVALHPEGVDRNAEKMPVIQEQIKGRPPPGGRG